MKWLFIIISVSLLTTFESQGQAKSEEEKKDLTTHPFYNTLYGTDCTIPEGTEILHYPMTHPTPSLKSEVEYILGLKKLVSYSSFNFIKLIEQNPSALIFAEGHTSQEVVDRTMMDVEPFRKTYSAIIDNMNRANSYEQLNSETSACLSQLSGAEIALLAGTTTNIYPSTTAQSHQEFVRFLLGYWNKQGMSPLIVNQTEVYLINEILNFSDQFNKEKDPVKKKQLKEKMYLNYTKRVFLNKLFEDFKMVYREKMLLKSVENVIRPLDNNKLVIINYGAFHNFSDDFKSYNFYTLPYACTMPLSYLSSPLFIFNLINIHATVSHSNPTDSQDILSILSSEMINRVQHLEETKGDASSTKLTPDHIDDIKILVWNQMASVQDKFENELNQLISLNDNQRKKHRAMLLQLIQSKYESFFQSMSPVNTVVDLIERCKPEEEEKVFWTSFTDLWKSW